MLVKFGITDGQVVPGREYTAEVDDNDLADCATLEGVRQTIAAAIEWTFRHRVGWYSGSMEPTQARALWEAAKAAQEESNAS